MSNFSCNNQLTDFVEQDFAKSGIPDYVCRSYKNLGYIQIDNDGYKIIYPELYQNIPTEYYNKRLKECSNGKKYIKPKGMTSRLFRPINLDLNLIQDEWLILTEGEKKAIKAVQEGFNCIALSGVWCWKCTPPSEDEDVEIQGIIPDLLNLNATKIALCFDSDMWEKDSVKSALYQLAAYLIAERKVKVKIVILPKGEEKGLDDYLIAHGSNNFKILLDNAQEITLKQIQEILSGDTTQKLTFPINVFNNEIRNFLVDTANRLDSPIEYLATSFLIGASVLMDGYYKLTANSSSNWIEYPILWGAIVGGPSQKKTPSINIIRSILATFEEKLQAEYEKKLQKYKKDMEEYKIKLNQAKKAKQGTYVEIPEEPIKPYPMVITVQDTTKEALATLVKNNQKRGVGIFVDELASFLKSFGQYKNGNGSDEEYFLQAWQKQPYRITRKSTEENYLIYPSHNILGAIQPKVLDKTLFKEGFDSINGMIERWLFVCTDHEEKGELHQAGRLDTSIVERIYTRLYENETVQNFYFSKEAKEIFLGFIREVTERKKSNGLTDLMKNYLQKQTSYVARFSIVLHCIHNDLACEITAETVKNAIELSNYFVKSFQKIANISFDSKSNELVYSALDYIKTKGLKTISPSKLHRSNKSRYVKLEDARDILLILANMGYGRLYKGEKKGLTFFFYK